MFGIGIQEFGVILVIALLVFGPKRLPELARMLGRGMGEFRRASHDLRQSLALDDLQNDLRRDLRSAQNAMKPDTLIRPGSKPDPAGERPGQAGDDLAAAAPAAGQAAPPASNPTADVPTDRARSGADVHQGELPLGNDYEHHDEPESETASETIAESDSGDREGSERTGEATRASGAADSERG